MSQNKVNHKATFAIYKTVDEVKMAQKSLKKLGFNDQDFLIFQSVADGDKDFSQVLRSQIKNGAVFGAILGGFILGSLFLFIGMHTLENFYGAAHFSILSKVFMILLSVLLGGIAGAACGVLVGVGIPDRAGIRFGQYLQSGGILLSVHNKNDLENEKSKSILQAAGGQDIQIVDEEHTWQLAIHEKNKLAEENLS